MHSIHSPWSGCRANSSPSGTQSALRHAVDLTCPVYDGPLSSALTVKLQHGRIQDDGQQGMVNALVDGLLDGL